MKAWIETHPYLALFLVGALLAASSFAVGRYSAAGPDVREVERIVYKDRVVEKIVEVKVKQAAEVKIVYREKTTKPDGTTVERTAERTDTKTDEKTDTKTDTERTAEGTRDVERVVIAQKPDWRVGALVGADVAFNPLAASLLVGVQVERRIAGPFSVGIWALVRPSPFGLAAGGSLALEF